MANKEKRKKFELTIDQKYLIIRHQTESIKNFNKEFSTVIKKQTMSDLLKPSNIKKITSLDDDKYNKRVRAAIYDNFIIIFLYMIILL